MAVCVRDRAVLVMRRHRAGRDYTVLPGGGIEEGEEPDRAVIRELAEETGLTGTVIRPLGVIDHGGRRAHCFQVDAVGAPRLGGPEAARASADNRYEPVWLPLALLGAEPLVPDALRKLVSEAADAQGEHDPSGR